MSLSTWIVLGLIVVAILWGILSYNRLVASRRLRGLAKLKAKINNTNALMTESHNRLFAAMPSILAFGVTRLSQFCGYHDRRSGRVAHVNTDRPIIRPADARSTAGRNGRDSRTRCACKKASGGQSAVGCCRHPVS